MLASSFRLNNGRRSCQGNLLGLTNNGCRSCSGRLLGLAMDAGHVRVVSVENPELSKGPSFKPGLGGGGGGVHGITLHATFTARNSAFLISLLPVHSSPWFLNFNVPSKRQTDGYYRHRHIVTSLSFRFGERQTVC